MQAVDITETIASTLLPRSVAMHSRGAWCISVVELSRVKVDACPPPDL